MALLGDLEANAPAITIRTKPRKKPFLFEGFDRLGGRSPRGNLKTSERGWRARNAVGARKKPQASPLRRSQGGRQVLTTRRAPYMDKEFGNFVRAA